jgi:hypothetical protein
MEPSPTERNLNPSRVKYLRERADRGMLLPFRWAEAIYDGRPVRVNGQHSSAMLHELNGSFPEGLTVHHDVYSVDSADDLVVLFHQFDPRKSGRSPADVAGAYQALYPDLREVPKATAKIGIDAVAWHRRYVVGAQVGAGDVHYVLFSSSNFHPFLRWLGGLLTIKTPELKRVPESQPCMPRILRMRKRRGNSGSTLRVAVSSTRIMRRLRSLTAG